MMDKETFLAWRRDPRTVEVLQHLEGRRQALMERWAGGQFLEPASRSQVNSGWCQALQAVLDLAHSDISNAEGADE